MKNSKIKEEIKRLANEQIALKPQRKTVFFSGDRTIDSYKAVQITTENKEKLRHLYVAYNTLRGKETEPFTKREFHKSLVDSYVEQYKEDFLPKIEE